MFGSRQSPEEEFLLQFKKDLEETSRRRRKKEAAISVMRDLVLTLSDTADEMICEFGADDPIARDVFEVFSAGCRLIETTAYNKSLQAIEAQTTDFLALVSGTAKGSERAVTAPQRPPREVAANGRY
jgi:hypothetical protein